MEPQRRRADESLLQIEQLGGTGRTHNLQVNGGGNIPNGGKRTASLSNPAGNEPPGWNNK